MNEEYHELPLDLLTAKFQAMDLPLGTVVVNNCLYPLEARVREFSSLEEIDKVLNNGSRHYVYKLYRSADPLFPVYYLRFATLVFPDE